MFRVQSAQIPQSMWRQWVNNVGCRYSTSCQGSAAYNNSTLRKVMIAGAAGIGSCGMLFMTPQVAFAAGHEDNAHIKHVMQEITEHAIWHEVGHVLHLGGFAAGMLGCLLSSQSLGEKDGPYIRKSITKPVITKCMNHRRGMVEDCLILANGREIIGQDILRFYKDLQSAQILKSLEKGGLIQ